VIPNRPTLAIAIALCPALLLATSCCGGACDDEVAKAEECNIPLTAERQALLDECDDLTDCEAECASTKSCGAFTGDNPDEAAQYLACLDRCRGTSD
jgi:hypothetical protein